MSIADERERELISTGFDTTEAFDSAKMRRLAGVHGQVTFTSATTGTTYALRVEEEAHDGDVYYVTLVKLESRVLGLAQQRNLTIRGWGSKARVEPRLA